MRQVSEQFKNNFRKMTRSVQGKVVCNNATYLSTDYLQSFNLVTEGINGKMFGYTLAATLKVVLIKKDNNLYVPKVGDTITPYLGAEDEYMRYQHFYVDSVKFINDKIIEVIAYDAMAKLNKLTYNDLVSKPEETDYVEWLATCISRTIGMEINRRAHPNWQKQIGTLNISGNESLRDILNDIAEFTGAICHIRADNLDADNLCLSNTHSYDTTVDKTQYFDFSKTENTCELSGIYATNSLGDSVFVGDSSKHVEVLKDNCLLTLRSDSEVQEILTNIKSSVTYILRPYTLKWRGYPWLEIGDYIYRIEDISDTNHYYLLDQNIKYNGGLTFYNDWQTTEDENADIEMQGTITDNIKKTYAKVDKVNNRVEIVAGDVTRLEVEIGSISGQIGPISEEAHTAYETAEGAKVTADEAISRVSTVETTVEGFRAEVEAAVTKSETAINTANSAESKSDSAVSKVGELELTVDSFETRISKAETDSTTAINTAGNAVTTANSASEKVGELEVTVDGFETRVSKAETDSTTAVNTANGAKTEAESATSAVGTLTTTVSGLTTTSQTHTEQIETINTTLGQKANQSDLNDLQDVVDDKADQTDLDATNGQITIINKDISDINTSLSTMDGKISSKADSETVNQLTITVNGKASQDDLDAVETLVNGKADQSTLDALQTVVDGKADSTTVSSIETRVASAEEVIDGLDGRFELKADKTVTDQLITDVSTIEGSVGTIQTTVNSQGERISAAEGAITLKADSSTVTTLTETVNGKADQSTVTTLAGRVTTAEANISANTGEISLRVKQSDFDPVSNKVNDHESRITQNSESISLQAETIALKADKTEIEGLVKFTDLSTANATTIDGSNIKTGTIAAERLDLSGTLTVGSNITNLNNNAGYITSGPVDDLIDDLELGRTTISGNCITTGTIDASVANITNINANNITSGSVSANRISGGTLSGTSININDKFIVDSDGNMTALNGEFNGETVNVSGNVSCDAIQCNDINVLHNLNTEDFFAERINTNEIEMGQKTISDYGSRTVTDVYKSFSTTITNVAILSGQTRISFKLEDTSTDKYLMNKETFFRLHLTGTTSTTQVDYIADYRLPSGSAFGQYVWLIPQIVETRYQSSLRIEIEAYQITDMPAYVTYTGYIKYSYTTFTNNFGFTGSLVPNRTDITLGTSDDRWQTLYSKNINTNGRLIGSPGSLYGTQAQRMALTNLEAGTIFFQII